MPIDTLKLSIVAPTAGFFGGTERVLETLITQLGSQSEIAIAFLSDGPLVQLAKSRGINCEVIERGHFRNPIDTVRVVRRLRKFIRLNESRVVLGWTDFAQLYGSLASFGICKSTWWQRSNVDRGWATTLRNNFPYSIAIANSCFVRDQLVSVGTRVLDKPLYPPFDQKRFEAKYDKQITRRALGLSEDRRIVGSIGRLQSWKGFDTFINALEKLRRTHTDVFGLIVGSHHDLEPEYGARLRLQISELGLTNDVMLVGSQQNVAEWMSAMDVFVHSAEREPFGIVVSEAMTLGLPVIASVPGGPAELIDNGISGLLVPSGDSEALSDALTKFLDRPDFALQCGSKARVHSQKFSSDGFVNRLRNAVASAVE